MCPAEFPALGCSSLPGTALPTQPDPCPLSRTATSRRELGTAQHICLPVTFRSSKPGASCGFGNAPVLSGVSPLLCRILGCSRVEEVGGWSGVPRAALGGGQHLLSWLLVCKPRKAENRTKTWVISPLVPIWEPHGRILCGILTLCSCHAWAGGLVMEPGGTPGHVP